jgi:hypothetical protein
MKSPDHAKETKTAKELEAMILDDLRNVVGCPERGVNVTVYGIPWIAARTQRPAAFLLSPLGWNPETPETIPPRQDVVMCPQVILVGRPSLIDMLAFFRFGQLRLGHRQGSFVLRSGGADQFRDLVVVVVVVVVLVGHRG